MTDEARHAGAAPLGRWTWVLGGVVLAFEFVGKLTDGGRMPQTSKLVEVAISAVVLVMLTRRTRRLRGRSPTRLLHLWKPHEVVIVTALASLPFWVVLATIVRGGQGDTSLLVALAALALVPPLLLLLRLRWELENPEAVPIMETAPARYALEPLHATWQGRTTLLFVVAGMGWIISERVVAATKLPGDRAWLGWLNVGAWCAFLAFGVVGALVMSRRRAREWREEFEGGNAG